jgi:hypothetical protein
MENLKNGCTIVSKMDGQTIKSITGNHHFLNAFNAAFLN